jgi:hypothetical protein
MSAATDEPSAARRRRQPLTSSSSSAGWAGRLARILARPTSGISSRFWPRPTRTRTLSAITSLVRSGQRLGYRAFTRGAAFTQRRPKNTIGERRLSEEDVQRMITAEPHARNHILILALSANGGRVSDVARGAC